jgi:hypothetical protein
VTQINPDNPESPSFFKRLLKSQSPRWRKGLEDGLGAREISRGRILEQQGGTHDPAPPDYMRDRKGKPGQ